MTVPPSPGSATTPTDRGALDRSLVRGIAWTGGAKWATQILSWISTLVVARLLTPADFGLVGMAGVYLGFAQLINEFGLAAAIVQRRNLDEDRVARLGGLLVLLGFGLFGISAALAVPIARFFREPAVRTIVLILSLTFVVNGWQVLPRSLLARDLDFRKVALLDGIESVLMMVATLVLALLGAGYWALVVSPVIAKAASTIVANAWRPHRRAWPRQFRTIAGEVAFGWRMVVQQVAWYVYSNADFAIVGRVLGKGPLGAYTIGWDLASIPVERISAMVSRVTPAVFATVQDDPLALRRYFRSVTEGLAYLTFPASIGLALVADEFVRVALGPAWHDAIVPLRLLALYAGFRSIATLYPSVLVATGNERASMQFNLLLAVVLPGLFYFGTRWGATGVALGWVVGYPLVALPFFLRRTLQVTQLSLRGYLAALWPAFSGTLVMAAAVGGARLLTTTRPGALALGIHIAAGALVYGGFMYLRHRERLFSFVRLVRGRSEAARPLAHPA